MSTRRIKYLRHIIRDLVILALGIVVAVFLVEIGIIAQFLEVTKGMQILASFVAGMFFTSVFTIAPASVALAALSTRLPLVDVAFFGALGAALVDYVIFTLVRDKVVSDMKGLFKLSVRKRLASLFHFGFMRWVVALLGGVIIASPLPDELGVALLSFSRIKPHHFVALTFVMNFLGIWLLGMTVQAIL